MNKRIYELGFKKEQLEAIEDYLSILSDVAALDKPSKTAIDNMLEAYNLVIDRGVYKEDLTWIVKEFL